MFRKIIMGFGLVMLAACGTDPRLPDFVELVESSAPAIVNISGSAKVQNTEPGAPPLFRWFRDFVEPEGEGQPPANRRPEASLGSGFILSSDGEILTNYHVVAQADEVLVTLADRRQFKAEVLGHDAASDLALLKIEARGLPSLEFGSSAELKVGEWVLAIGSPFGFEQTATAGIVSGKRRALASEQYVPFLQTDVAINPGNSGGPLFNLDGEVIGINSQIFSQTGGYMGLSFAIPSDTAINVIRQLREYGRVKRAWLGVVIQKVDADLAESFGLDQATGALVSHVEPDGPAAGAGLRSGDVILEIDGEVVPSSGALPPLIGRRAPGEVVRVLIMRDGSRSHLRVELAELPVSGESLAQDWTGVELDPVSDRQRQQLQIDHGLVVRQLEREGAAARAGLLPGDVLISWEGEALNGVEDWRRLAAATGKGETVPLLVMRGGRTLFIPLRRGNPDP